MATVASLVTVTVWSPVRACIEQSLISLLGTLTTMKDGKPFKEVVPTVEPPTYTEYYRKLVRALDGEGDLPASGADASLVIRLIELARESSQTGKTLEV